LQYDSLVIEIKQVMLRNCKAVDCKRQEGACGRATTQIAAAAAAIRNFETRCEKSGTY